MARDINWDKSGLTSRVKAFQMESARIARGDSESGQSGDQDDDNLRQVGDVEESGYLEEAAASTNPQDQGYRRGRGRGERGRDRGFGRGGNDSSILFLHSDMESRISFRGRGNWYRRGEGYRGRGDSVPGRQRGRGPRRGSPRGRMIRLVPVDPTAQEYLTSILGDFDSLFVSAPVYRSPEPSDNS